MRLKTLILLTVFLAPHYGIASVLTQDGLVIDGVGGTVTVTGLTSVTGGAGAGIEIKNNSLASASVNLGDVSISGTGDAGISIFSNSNGTFTFSGSTTVNTGAQHGVSLATNTGATTNFTGGGLDIDTTSGTGFAATSGGTVNVTGTPNTIDSTNAPAIDMDNTTIGASGMAFSSVNSANSGTAGIDLENLSGSIAIQGGSISGSVGTAFNTQGGDATVSYGGTISNTAGRMISVSDTTGGSVTLNTATPNSLADSGTGILIDGAAGNVTVNNADLNGSGGIEVLGDAGNNATGSFTFNTVTIDTTAGASNHALKVDGDQGTPANDDVSATIDLNNVDITNPGGLVASIEGMSGGSVDFDSASTINRSNGGLGVSVASNTAGTITFGGSTKTLNTSSNTAVTLASSSGITVGFAGGALDIDTTSGNGIDVSGGGTLNITGGTNAVTTTTTGKGFEADGGGTLVVTGDADINTTGGTGVGVDIQNTTIGASGVTFESVSVNGAANGVLLNNTGASGGLTITGDGSTATQGGNGTGGTLSNTTGVSVSVVGSIDLNLKNMRVDSPASHGIDISELGGTCRLDNLTVDDVDTASTHGVRLLNFATSNLDFTIDNCRFTESDTGSSMVLVQFRGAIGTTSIDVEDSRFDALDPRAFQLDGYEGSGTQTTGTLNHTFLSNTIEDSDVDGTSDTSHSGGGQLDCTFTIQDNTYEDLAKAGSFNAGLLNAGYGGGAITPGTTMVLTISGNELSATDPSSTGNRRGINVVNEHSGGAISAMDVFIDNNDVDDMGDREALYFSNRSPVTALDVWITRNLFGTGAIPGTTANNIGGTRDGVFIENRAGTTNLLFGGSVANANTILTDNNASDAIVEIESDDATGAVNATVTDNTFSSTGDGRVEFDMQADSSAMCVDLKNNAASNTGTEWVFDGNGHPTGIKVEGAGTGNVTEGQLQGAPHNNTGNFTFTAPVTNNNNTDCPTPTP